jgi:hypothetical protein
MIISYYLILDFTWQTYTLKNYIKKKFFKKYILTVLKRIYIYIYINIYIHKKNIYMFLIYNKL